MAASAAIKGFLADVREYTKIPLSSPIDSKFYVSPFSDEDFKVAPSRTIPETENNSSKGGMEPFTVLEGVAAPMPQSNIDTDKIIPKQFLKTIKRTGLGTALFYEVRYKDDQPNPDFVLNNPKFSNSKILVAGDNFGCGSSREHAPWALLDFGIKCIIAPSFADIFSNNCTKNGMLPIRLSEDEVQELLEYSKSGKCIKVDLPNQTVTAEKEYSFQIDGFVKHCLLNGFDDISLTLQKEEQINAFEAKRSSLWSWLDGERYKRVIVPTTTGKMDW